MKHILNTLAFYAANSGLHSFSKTHRPTRRAIKALEKRQMLHVSWETSQAEFTHRQIK
jgi:hypothetical protein